MLTPTRLRPALPHRRVALALGAAAAIGVPTLAVPAVASASHRQVTIIQDGNLLVNNPGATLLQMRSLGATAVRVVLYWSSVAPRAESTHRPHFAASSPGAYPSANWNFYDAVVRDAAADGLTVDLTVTGGAPRWAEGPGIPANYVAARNPAAKYYAWRPSAADFGEFMHAVAARYSGHFRPSGASEPLPRVHFWTLWNEPNFGVNLGPQATDTSRISFAPMMYRNLVRSGYRALDQTGHARDTILIGDFAAHGHPLTMGKTAGGQWPQGLPGISGQTQPLPFVRTLYCLNQSGHVLTGTAARQTGCPTTGAGRARFRRDNPGLFSVTGVGDHPYANNATPLSDGKGNPNWSTFPNFPRLEHTLDQANRVWGSHKRYPIYSDEYGYITDPPNTKPGNSVPTRVAARYINWAEYLSYNEPRTASYDQYLINDPEGSGSGAFATGLYTFGGKAKPSLDAFRLPLWIPSQTLRHPGRARVWGEARPAHFTGLDTKRRQAVEIQFQAHDRGPWRTISTIHSNTYFVARPLFRSSGNVRLSYTYPKNDDPLLPLSVSGHTIVSRVQHLTVR
jgi:hypothetical protein